MGRATEFYYYINKDKVSADDKLKITNLTITDEIEKLRKSNITTKKTGLIPKDDGSFMLF